MCNYTSIKYIYIGTLSREYFSFDLRITRWNFKEQNIIQINSPIGRSWKRFISVRSLLSAPREKWINMKNNRRTTSNRSYITFCRETIKSFYRIRRVTLSIISFFFVVLPLCTYHHKTDADDLQRKYWFSNRHARIIYNRNSLTAYMYV